ncbi:AlpA family transcriptional regulator [Mycobacterium sp. SP-6446]|uniref:helix-turn-helix transcriptional regulator n=1 Tax=Mycobacterium sp. SP-6446 TaxID=1834162 RepID=UPI00096D2895|nr:helix-turn-helix domain-containing protein [Mycobacterium sp. SP-6446]OMC14937.1 hypothetical protein A5736_20355 [Mycobacterium sp. SP-6446]
MQTKLIDQRGVANEYGVPVQTQNKLHDRGAFAQRFRIGGKWYYRRSQLEAWLDAQRVVATHRGVKALPTSTKSDESCCAARPDGAAHGVVMTDG